MNPHFNNIKMDCFFCEVERDMGALWYVCSYDKDIDRDYWQKNAPCINGKDCPRYCSKSSAFHLVHFIKETTLKTLEVVEKE